MPRLTLLEQMVDAGQIPASVADVTMPIICDDVVAYLETQVGRRMQDILAACRGRPPFQQAWLEFCPPSAPGDTWDDLGAWACDISVLERGGPSALLAFNRYCMLHGGQPLTKSQREMTHPNAIVVGCYMKATMNGSSQIRRVCNMLIWYDKDWTPVDGTIGQLIEAVEGIGSERVAAQIELALLFSLALLNVKNVELRPASSRKTVPHIRGRTGIRIRTLVITPMRAALRAIAREMAEHPDQRLPLHLCRGHFKTFTEAAPLFGKYTGVYWWDPCWRGNGTMGLVLHDRAEIRVGT